MIALKISNKVLQFKLNYCTIIIIESLTLQLMTKRIKKVYKMPRGKRKSKEEEENVSTAKTTPVEKRTAKQTKTKGEKKSTSKTNPVVEESLQVADAASHDKQINKYKSARPQRRHSKGVLSLGPSALSSGLSQSFLL